VNFAPTGITKKDYLDIIELVVDAYGVAELEKWLEMPDEIYYFTAFRTSQMLAYVVSTGRRPELLSLWEKVTEKAMRGLEKSVRSGYTDMTIEALCTSFLLMREYVKPEWMEQLRNTRPETHYQDLNREDFSSNMVNGMVGMIMREKVTGEKSQAYFERIMPFVLEYIDENGMFEDYEPAMLYDINGRLRFTQLMWNGYDGKWAKEIDDFLCRSGEFSLKMQSATFQIPYGGRSNQFLHNEVLQAGVFEYEACRWKKLGDMKKAGEFKRAAHLSVMSVMKYLNLPGGTKHIRNKFPQNCLFGIDFYGTFPRYMQALATFVSYAYEMADDSIEEVECPAERGGYAFRTSMVFDKVFAAVEGQSVEYALMSQHKHEVSGLGRYHARGIPSELGLSMPFTAKPVYLLSQNCVPYDLLGPRAVEEELREYVTDVAPSCDMAISSGYIDSDGNRHLFCEKEQPWVAEILEETPDKVSFAIKWQLATETITLDSDGLHIKTELSPALDGRAFWAVPLLKTNGASEAEYEVSDKKIVVNFEGCKNTVISDIKMDITDELTANRNGIYRIMHVDSDTNTCSVSMKLSK